MENISNMSHHATLALMEKALDPQRRTPLLEVPLAELDKRQDGSLRAAQTIVYNAVYMLLVKTSRQVQEPGNEQQKQKFMALFKIEDINKITYAMAYEIARKPEEIEAILVEEEKIAEKEYLQKGPCFSSRFPSERKEAFPTEESQKLFHRLLRQRFYEASEPLMSRIREAEKNKGASR